VNLNAYFLKQPGTALREDARCILPRIHCSMTVSFSAEACSNFHRNEGHVCGRSLSRHSLFCSSTGKFRGKVVSVSFLSSCPLLLFLLICPTAMKFKVLGKTTVNSKCTFARF
jgi:hypothetical protein